MKTINKFLLKKYRSSDRHSCEACPRMSQSGSRNPGFCRQLLDSRLIHSGMTTLGHMVMTIGLLGFSNLSSAEENPVFLRWARPMGMGGAFTALADDQNLFFFNPAGLVQRTGPQFTLLDLPITLADDFRTLADFINDHETELKDFNTLTPTRQAALINDIDRTITMLNPHIGLGVPNLSYLSGPKAMWMLPFHIGTGLFVAGDGRFRVTTGLVPNIEYNATVDGIVPVAVAKRWEDLWVLPGKFSAGAMFKYIQRYRVRDSLPVIALEDFDSPQIQKGKGLGLDIGTLWQPNSRWNLALVAQDLFGTKIKFDAIEAKKGFSAKPAGEGNINPRWNFGAAWTPKNIIIIPTGNRLTFSADIKDIFNSNSKTFFGDGNIIPDTFWTHLHLGAEYRFWFLKLRGGANQGYPTFGAGIDLPVIKLDYAYYSDELSRFAGQLREGNHIISLALRFGSGGTEARKRVGK